jgi:hypothetical protein
MTLEDRIHRNNVEALIKRGQRYKLIPSVDRTESIAAAHKYLRDKQAQRMLCIAVQSNSPIQTTLKIVGGACATLLIAYVSLILILSAGGN